jgi:hypothetical protein
MPTSRSRTTTGVILVGIGMLCEIAAFSEQPDLVQFGPNRFYTAVDLIELEAAHQALHDLQTGRDLMNESSEQDAHVDAAKLSDRATRIAAAESKFTALQQKQDSAFRNQGIVSQALKWVGIALLVAAAIFLVRTRRTMHSTLANATSD